MAMRKRAGGTILSQAMADRGVDPAQDPGSLLKPMAKVSAPPICHCPVNHSQGILGGQDPVIRMSDPPEVACRTCGRLIGPGCRRRQVVWLREMAKKMITHPHHVDVADLRAAGLILE